MKHHHTHISEEYIQGLIFEANETTPSADPARLAAIEYRLPVRQQQRTTAMRKHIPWWVIGLTLMTGVAAAWWAMENISLSSDQATDEISMSPAQLKHPAVSGQAGNTASSEERSAAERSVNNANDSQESVHDNKTGRIERKDSSVIYRREVF